MKSKRYRFVQDGPERLEVSWGRGFGKLVVEMDGQQVNAEPLDRTTVKQGTRMSLTDGSTLWIRAGRNGLELTRDGSPLPGSATDPRTVAKSASNILWFIAGLTVAATFLLYLDVRVVFWISLGSALVFGALALLVRRGNLVALWVALVLYSVDALATMAGAVQR